MTYERELELYLYLKERDFMYELRLRDKGKE
jgi:hypothetical protein